MNNNQGNIMNRRIKPNSGRNAQSITDQFIKETSNFINKTNNLSNHLDRRRKVFNGDKQEKLKLKEEYKEVCDIQLNNKTSKTHQIKNMESIELKKNQKILDQKNQNDEKNSFLKKNYEKNLQHDNKTLLVLSQTNKRHEKLADMHQDMINLKNDFFTRSLMSYR